MTDQSICPKESSTTSLKLFQHSKRRQNSKIKRKASLNRFMNHGAYSESQNLLAPPPPKKQQRSLLNLDRKPEIPTNHRFRPLQWTTSKFMNQTSPPRTSELTNQAQNKRGQNTNSRIPTALRNLSLALHRNQSSVAVCSSGIKNFDDGEGQRWQISVVLFMYILDSHSAEATKEMEGGRTNE